MPSLDRQALRSSVYELSDADTDDLVQFGSDCVRLLGSALHALELHGPPDAPVLSVLFSSERQRPGVIYSYDWRLHGQDESDPGPNPLYIMLVDYLGNNITSDLQSSPGLPMWEPDEDGIVHVDVLGQRYESWPQEWRQLGGPWRDEAGRLRYDSESR